MGSRRWSFKVYDKQAELLHHAKKGPLPPHLFDWAAGVVRFELTLRRPELVEHAGMVGQLRGEHASRAARQIWQSYFDRITFNENAQMANRSLLEDALPGHLAIKLAAWRGGADLRGIMTRRTFYRVRRDLLTTVGVDIASPPPTLARDARTEGSALDPAGWDPEPIKAHFVEPDGMSEQYGFNIS
jgi:II/X family phage/plasmid replication protein